MSKFQIFHSPPNGASTRFRIMAFSDGASRSHSLDTTN